MSTATNPKPAAAASGPKDGLPSMLSYLTRVLKMPTIGAFWEELADQARDSSSQAAATDAPTAVFCGAASSSHREVITLAHPEMWL